VGRDVPSLKPAEDRVLVDDKAHEIAEVESSTFGVGEQRCVLPSDSGSPLTTADKLCVGLRSRVPARRPSRVLNPCLSR
jgi:hypothetical protein